MAGSTDKFSVLYRPSLVLQTKGTDGATINISPSDIVSMTIIHDFDNATFPIIRIRLYSDLSIMEKLTQYPDQIFVRLYMTGMVYRMADQDNKSPTPVTGAKSLSFSLKGYIENKNIPTSIMDQYDHGIKKKSDLNIDRKVPIEIYCYDNELIHYMRRKASSIFKDMSITTVIETLFRKQGIVKYSIQPTKNQEKYDQVLIPNLSINETLSFFDNKYGLYEKGAQVYGDMDKLYICDSDVNNGEKPLPIHIESYKNSSDMGGMRRVGGIDYHMNTKAENVSVVSETDIERVLNSEEVTSINVKDLSVDKTEMVKLFPELETGKKAYERISTPDLLHKTRSKYTSKTYVARISERITRVDLSGVGFDIGKMNIMTRYNLIFDSPIRGMSMNQLYRTSVINHVISNLDSGLFIAQTTMTLCSN
jgi:hypothetical protein